VDLGKGYGMRNGSSDLGFCWGREWSDGEALEGGILVLAKALWEERAERVPR
jgi:hypothetical protein